MTVDFKSPVSSTNVNSAYISRKEDSTSIGKIDFLDTGGVQNPSQLDVKKDTEANLITYAATATDGQVCFSTDTLKFFIIHTSILNEAGGGGGGLDEWVSAAPYLVGDIVWLSTTNTIYRCITLNSDVTFISTNWQRLSNDATLSLYDNSTSGLAATNTQDAIDEVENRVDTNETDIASNIINIDELESKTTNTKRTEDFEVNLPSAVYSETGVTNTVVDETTTPLDGSTSASFTITTGDSGGELIGAVYTTLKPVEFELQGRLLDWKYDGDNEDVSLFIEESSDGVVYTNASKELKLPSTEAKTIQVNFQLEPTTTHYRPKFVINTDNDTKVMGWTNERTISNPNQYMSLVKENTYSARIANNGTATVTSDNESFVDTAVRTSLGIVRVTLKSGFFSVPPSIVATVESDYHFRAGVNLVSTNVYDIQSNNRTGVLADKDFNISLQRQLLDYTSPETGVVFQGQTSELDTIAYTPTIQGATGNTGVDFTWRREGDSLYIQGKYIIGTTNGSELQLGLPTGLTIKSGQPVKNIGTLGRGANTTTSYQVLSTGGDNFLNVAAMGGGGMGLAPTNGNSFFINGDAVSFYATVPIEGWKASDILYTVAGVGLKNKTGGAEYLTGETLDGKKVWKVYVSASTASAALIATGVDKIVSQGGTFTVSPTNIKPVPFDNGTNSSFFLFSSSSNEITWIADATRVIDAWVTYTKV